MLALKYDTESLWIEVLPTSGRSRWREPSGSFLLKMRISEIDEVVDQVVRPCQKASKLPITLDALAC
jgi:hypothetical protein